MPIRSTASSKRLVSSSSRGWRGWKTPHFLCVVSYFNIETIISKVKCFPESCGKSPDFNYITTSITQKSGDFPQLTELIDGFYPRFDMGDLVGPWWPSPWVDDWHRSMEHVYQYEGNTLKHTSGLGGSWILIRIVQHCSYASIVSWYGPMVYCRCSLKQKETREFGPTPMISVSAYIYNKHISR